MSIVIDNRTGKKIQIERSGGTVRARYPGHPNFVFGESENDAVRKLLGTSDRPPAKKPRPEPIGPGAWEGYVGTKLPEARPKVEAAPVGAISKNGKFRKQADGSWANIQAASAGK